MKKYLSTQIGVVVVEDCVTWMRGFLRLAASHLVVRIEAYEIVILLRMELPMKVPEDVLGKLDGNLGDIDSFRHGGLRMDGGGGWARFAAHP